MNTDEILNLYGRSNYIVSPLMFMNLFHNLVFVSLLIVDILYFVWNLNRQNTLYISYKTFTTLLADDGKKISVRFFRWLGVTQDIFFFSLSKTVNIQNSF